MYKRAPVCVIPVTYDTNVRKSGILTESESKASYGEWLWRIVTRISACGTSNNRNNMLPLPMGPLLAQAVKSMKKKPQASTLELKIIEGGRKKNLSVTPEAWKYYRAALERREEALHEHALALFDRAISLCPEMACAWRDRGEAKTGILNEEALADLNQAIHLDPKDPVAYHKRALAKCEMKRYEEAIADLDIAIHLDPQTAYYHARGRIKYEIDRYEDAVDDYGEAIRLDPGRLETYYDRAWSYELLGRYEDALRDYDRIIGIDPGLPRIYFERGKLKSMLGKHENALEDYLKSVELRPDYQDVFEALLNTQKKLGLVEEDEFLDTSLLCPDGDPFDK